MENGGAMTAVRQGALEWTGASRVLIADDEPDVHAVTKLTLKGLARKFGPMEFISSYSGAETVAALRRDPGIGVVLLDVVMETDHAGLEVCRAIRRELGNPLVRVLLRTGQPGVAPEQQTIDSYDIDGYLAKTETSASRLYTAVRCALKSYQELVTLERHRAYLAAAHDCAVSLQATMPVEQMLRRVLDAVLALCPAPLVLLELETFGEAAGPRRLFLYLASDPDAARAEIAAEDARVRVRAGVHRSATRAPSGLDGGFYVPVRLHDELGHGWLYLDRFAPDEPTRQTLVVLAAHAQNAIYASIALAASRERKSLVFQEAAI